MISLAIIARNEEQTISKCIDSASFFSDIIVLVNGSVDQSAQIAKQKGVRVISYDGQLDFAEMRNTCLSRAKNDFVFFLDADERMSPQNCKIPFKQTIF
jgi:glycosyltransferase involved in cell wall biosynthesis